MFREVNLLHLGNLENKFKNVIRRSFSTLDLEEASCIKPLFLVFAMASVQPKLFVDFFCTRVLSIPDRRDLFSIFQIICKCDALFEGEQVKKLLCFLEKHSAEELVQDSEFSVVLFPVFFRIIERQRIHFLDMSPKVLEIIRDIQQSDVGCLNLNLKRESGVVGAELGVVGSESRVVSSDTQVSNDPSSLTFSSVSLETPTSVYLSQKTPFSRELLREYPSLFSTFAESFLRSFRFLEKDKLKTVLTLSIKYYDSLEFQVNSRKVFFEFVQGRSFGFGRHKRDAEQTLFSLVQLAYFLCNHKYKPRELARLNGRETRGPTSTYLDPNDPAKLANIERVLRETLDTLDAFHFDRSLETKEVLFMVKFLHTRNLKSIKDYQRGRARARTSNPAIANRPSNFLDLEFVLMGFCERTLRRGVFKNHLGFGFLFKLFELLEYMEAFARVRGHSVSSIEGMNCVNSTDSKDSKDSKDSIHRNEHKAHEIGKLIKTLEFGFAYHCVHSRFSEGNAKVIKHVAGYFVGNTIGSRKFKRLMFAFLDGEDFATRSRLYQEYLQTKDSKMGLEKKGEARR